MTVCQCYMRGNDRTRPRRGSRQDQRTRGETCDGIMGSIIRFETDDLSKRVICSRGRKSLPDLAGVPCLGKFAFHALPAVWISVSAFVCRAAQFVAWATFRVSMECAVRASVCALVSLSPPRTGRCTWRTSKARPMRRVARFRGIRGRKQYRCGPLHLAGPLHLVTVPTVVCRAVTCARSE